MHPSRILQHKEEKHFCFQNAPCRSVRRSCLLLVRDLACAAVVTSNSSRAEHRKRTVACIAQLTTELRSTVGKDEGRESGSVSKGLQVSVAGATQESYSELEMEFRYQAGFWVPLPERVRWAPPGIEVLQVQRFTETRFAMRG